MIKIIITWIKNLFKWFIWKFRVAKDVVENIKTPKHSHTKEKARRKKQITRGLLNFDKTI